MTMKVRFFVSKHEARSQRSSDALTACCGLTIMELLYMAENEGGWVMCTGNQFARFIIKRNELNGSNSIKAMKPIIIDSDEFIDTTDRKKK